MTFHSNLVKIFALLMLLQYLDIHMDCYITWTVTRENLQRDCASSADSDKPGHPPSLIRVFAVRMEVAQTLSYPLSAEWRVWLDRPDAKADLCLRLAHSHFVGLLVSRLTCQNDVLILVKWQCRTNRSSASRSTLESIALYCCLWQNCFITKRYQ